MEGMRRARFIHIGEVRVFLPLPKTAVAAGAGVRSGVGKHHSVVGITPNRREGWRALKDRGVAGRTGVRKPGLVGVAKKLLVPQAAPRVSK